MNRWSTVSTHRRTSETGEMYKTCNGPIKLEQSPGQAVAVNCQMDISPTPLGTRGILVSLQRHLATRHKTRDEDTIQWGCYSPMHLSKKRKVCSYAYAYSTLDLSLWFEGSYVLQLSSYSNHLHSMPALIKIISALSLWVVSEADWCDAYIPIIGGKVFDDLINIEHLIIGYITWAWAGTLEHAFWFTFSSTVLFKSWISKIGPAHVLFG